MLLKKIIKKVLVSFGILPESASLFERKLKNLQDRTRVEWLGTEYGGNFIPKDLSIDQDEASFLFGAGEDISFDCEIAKKFSGKVFIFDPTPRAIEHFEALKSAVSEQKSFAINKGERNYTIQNSDFDKISFHPYGISDENKTFRFYKPQNPDHVSCSIVNLQNTDDYFEAQCYTLSQLKKDMNQDKLAIVKLNIEGAEYQAIESMIVEKAFPRCLLVVFDEIHSPIDKDAEKRIMACIKKLEANGMEPFFMYKQYGVFKQNKPN